MSDYDRRSASRLPVDLLARLALALRAVLRQERSEVSVQVLVREFTREARAAGLPPEATVTAFKDALGAPPPRSLEGRYQAVRERLIAQCIELYYEPSESVPPPLGADEQRDGRLPYVALVDDDALVTALLSHALADRCRVVQFSDARSALASFYAERPDLVVFDVHLPDYSGQTLLAVLRADDRLRSVPAVVITGDQDERLESQLRSDGFVAYFRKPVLDPEAFVRTVHELLVTVRPADRGASSPA